MFYGKAVTILSPLLKITFTYAEKSQYYLSYCCSPHPHTRGIVIYITAIHHIIRITPAYAGKRVPQFVGVVVPKDHPRIRGEKRQTDTFLDWMKGSPPHTRGKDESKGAEAWLPGITPAYAGKRVLSYIEQAADRDHPRIRGEKWLVMAQVLVAIGSPPHTRGKDHLPIYGSA